MYSIYSQLIESKILDEQILSNKVVMIGILFIFLEVIIDFIDILMACEYSNS